MKLEKRCDAEELKELEAEEAAGTVAVSDPPEATPESPTPGRKKSVLSYIMILFIAAFLLMAMSFIMHQRSNDAAMNQLQSSVNAIQNAQGLQERVIELQDELLAAEEKLAAQEKAVQEANAAQQAQLEEKEHQAAALTRLTQLLHTQDSAQAKALVEEMQRMEDEAVLDLSYDGDEASAPSALFRGVCEKLGL